MFTTVMFGVINEVTRQPGRAELPVGRRATTAGTEPTRRPVRRAPRESRPLGGQYRVLADAFRRAAGFH